MKYIINNIRLGLDEGMDILKGKAAKRLGTSCSSLSGFRVVKESIDARRKPDIYLVYSVIAEIDGKARISSDGSIRELEENDEWEPVPGNIRLNNRPVIVGSGPAGIFAGLVLSMNGYRPIILERGASLEQRIKAVSRYWEKGELDTETNVQFGEGGAGTFSDGKLTTRINDRRCERVLKEFFESGAHEEILYKAKPHIGSDVLRSVVVNMRERIIQSGGEFRFESKLTSLIIKDGKVRGAVINGSETIDTDVLILAAGHSARDTYSELYRIGVRFIQKPFSIGVRIEHPQELINMAQYGKAAGHHRLGAADYQLFFKTGGRTVYSFCMCPGGVVVASASEKETIVTNGMSEFARDRENANSALVVSVNPEDFDSSHPLAGIDFQRVWEKLAFKAGGRNNAAPVQKLGDFISGVRSKSWGRVKPSYTGNISSADLNMCLPGFVTGPMKESIAFFDRRIRGFGMQDALLTGVETRTSSPVRIPRGETLEAEGIAGLYPAGEGAGYAGGIVSAAVDGIRIAEQVIKTYARPVHL
jgi:uncharacterized FAD-dependent dehydrogenase